MQICTLAQYGPSRWLSAWNIIDICTYVFQILISIAYFGRCALAVIRMLCCSQLAGRSVRCVHDSLMYVGKVGSGHTTDAMRRWQLKSDALSTLSALQAC